MSSRFKFIGNEAVYFTTLTVPGGQVYLPGKLEQFCFWNSKALYNHRLNCLYWNPVRAGFIAKPCHSLYSSATDYFTEKGDRWTILF